METIKINNEEVAKKFNEWWAASFKGNVPVYHQLDLDRFAELVKLTYNKQDIFNASLLHDFLYEQLEKGNLKKNQEMEIDLAIALYAFGVNNMSKLF